MLTRELVRSPPLAPFFRFPAAACRDDPYQQAYSMHLRTVQTAAEAAAGGSGGAALLQALPLAVASAPAANSPLLGSAELMAPLHRGLVALLQVGGWRRAARAGAAALLPSALPRAALRRRLMPSVAVPSDGTVGPGVLAVPQAGRGGLAGGKGVGLHAAAASRGRECAPGGRPCHVRRAGHRASGAAGCGGGRRPARRGRMCEWLAAPAGHAA